MRASSSAPSAETAPLGRRWWWLALLPAAVVFQLTASRFPHGVETLYARGFYPLVRSVLRFSTGWASFSIAECLLLGAVAALAWWAGRWWARFRAERGARGRLLRETLVKAAGLAGLLYASFLLLWGLNYDRLPWATIAGLSASRAERSELEGLCRELAEESVRFREGLPEDARGVMRLPDGRDGGLRRAHLGFRVAGRRYPSLGEGGGRPKGALASVLLSHLGISGIFIPFTGEAHVNTTLPEVEVPFAASHELAHQRGFAREDEANYLAYVACRDHPDRDFRYAGAFMAGLYAQVALRAVDPAGARRVEVVWSAGVRRDVRALAEWSARYQGHLQDVSRRVNDAYLKSQGQATGVRSYGRMVDLLLAERAASAPASPGPPRAPGPR